MERLDVGVWCEGDATQGEDQKIDVHLNFWKLSNSKYLDIGICYQSARKILIKIFFNKRGIIKDDIKDLSGELEKETIRNIIFNEYTPTRSCDKSAQKCWIATTEHEEFCINGQDKNISVEQKYNGSLIIVDLENSRCDGCLKKQYLRLRVKGSAIEDSFIQEPTPQSRLDYYTSNFEFLDFRLNNVRSLPQPLVQERQNFPRLKHIRCFLMIESGEEIKRYSEVYKRLRPLEKDAWNVYMEPINGGSLWKSCIDFLWKMKPISKEKRGRAILAYQWNGEDKQDFSIFVETKTCTFGCLKVLMVLIVALFFSALASLAASYIFEWLKNN